MFSCFMYVTMLYFHFVEIDRVVVICVTFVVGIRSALLDPFLSLFWPHFLFLFIFLWVRLSFLVLCCVVVASF